VKPARANVKRSGRARVPRLPLPVEVGEAPLVPAVRPAHEDLGGGVRLAGGERHHRAVARERVARDRARAADHAPGGAALRLRPVQRDRALVLGRDGERATVAAPDRRHPEDAARAVEGLGVAPRGPARGRHREETDVAAEGVADGPTEIGHRVAGGRERGMARGPVTRGETARRAALRGDEPDVDHVVAVALVVPRGGEGDRAAIGRPRRIRVVVVALGDLPRLAAVETDREDVGAPVVGEALPVEAVLERGDDPRRPRLPLLLLRVRLDPAADPRDEGQPAALGRPCRRAHPVAQVGEPSRLAARERHDVELALLLGLSLGDEGQTAAVGRPARRGVAARPRGEAARGAARGVHQPDLREVLVALLGELGDHERHRAPVGGHLGVADEADAGEIGRDHAARGRHRARIIRRHRDAVHRDARLLGLALALSVR